jgi:uncharacterized RDD family membrane protein YckC
VKKPNQESQFIALRTTRCGLARRIGSIFYDALIVVGLLLIAAAGASPFDQGNQQALRDPVFTLYLLTVWYLYLALCWRYLGMTVGMRAWRVQILSNDEDKVSWKSSMIRFSGSLISAACAGLGFIWSLFDPEKRCWHDRLSRTGLYRVSKK